MKRRKSREYALQFLYRIDFTGVPEGGLVGSGGDRGLKNDIEDFWKVSGEHDPDVRSFAEDIITGTVTRLTEIDPIIQKVAEKWSLTRIAAVDRNIIRFASYELLYRKDIPEAVTINEALEIAKKYSSAESASFINGILDRIAKEYCSK